MAQWIRDFISSQGLGEQVTGALLQAIDSAHYPDEPLDRRLARAIKGMLVFDPTLPGEQRAVAMIGPPGAGKSTVIVKLAAHMRQAFNYRVGLIAMVDQAEAKDLTLQSYAAAMTFDCVTIDDGSASTLSQAISVFEGYDLVLIDTVGVADKDSAGIAQLAAVFGESVDLEKILILPATIEEADAAALAKSFGPLGCSRCILTKLDRVNGNGGAILATLTRLAKPVAFLATGPQVPFDLEPATARRIGWLIARFVH